MGATQGSPALLLLLLAVGTQTTLCSSKKIACHTRTSDWGGDAAKIPLQCEDTEWIHVIWETVAFRGSETHCIHSNCSAVRKDDQSGLSLQCSRQSNCSEVVDLGGLAACDGGLQADYVAVSYECIPGSAVYDLRSETVQEISSTAVYLSTIGDGQNTFVPGSNRLRRCRLTASGPRHVSVEALELYFQDGVELNITDNCREGGGWVHGRNKTDFANKRLLSIECSSADITFHDHGNTPHLAWLRFTATSPLTLTCHVTDPAPTFPSTEVKVTAVAGAGETPDKDENPPTDDHNPVPTAIGVSVPVTALGIVLAIALVRRRRAHAVQKSEETTNRRDNNNERNTLEQEALLPPSAQARPNTAPLSAAERGEGEGDARSGVRRPGPGDTDEDALVYNILYESSRGKDAEQAGREEVASQRSALGAARQEELHYAVSGASPGYGIARRREAGETADDVMGDGVSHEAPQAAAVTPRALARDEGSLAARDQPMDRAGGQQDFLVDNVLYESSQPKAIANGGPEEARQQDSTEDQPSTDARQQDSTEDQPSMDARQQDRNFLVDNVLYESSHPRPEKSNGSEGK